MCLAFKIAYNPGQITPPNTVQHKFSQNSVLYSRFPTQQSAHFYLTAAEKSTLILHNPTVQENFTDLTS